MKNKIMLAAFILSLTTVGFAQQEKKQDMPVLISAYGTSYSATSANAICPLDPSCKGYWQPQSQDGGTSEGIYFKFDKPLSLNRIKIKLEGDLSGKISITPFLDASNTEDIPCSLKDAKENYLFCRCHYPGEEKDIDSNIIFDMNEDAFKEEKITCHKTLTVSMDNTQRDGTDTLLILPQEDDKKHTVLNNPHRTFFFKITENQTPVAPKIKEVTFVGKDDKPLQVQLPQVVKAKADATSTLSPEFAYSAANLFDQRLEMAWSTEGKNTSGIGEKINITFDKKQEITGLQIWNGYQRSDAHYKANARVKKLDINGQTIALKDKQGMQVIMFPQPIKAKNITLEIQDIYKGTKYKDVLLSELAFVGKEGHIILPQVQMPTVKAENMLIKPDTSYSSVLNIRNYGTCSTSSLRLRENGNFVIYDHQQNAIDWRGATSNEYIGIFEGNWEPTDENKVRLFGKKYVAQKYYDEYRGKDTSKSNSVVAIFQSALTMKLFNDLSVKEKKEVVLFFVSEAACDVEDVGKDIYCDVYVRKPDQTEIELDTLDKLIPALEKINPIYVKSDVYVDLLVPTDKVKLCE